MKYTHLGRTGVTVSRICLGCMSYGSKAWRPWVLEEEDSMPFFRKAIESGVNFFDTANVTSLGVSEEITGKALREYGNLEEIVIATKVRFNMSRKPNMSGLSRKHIVQACEASLKRLGVDKIDLYQIHRTDPHTPMDEVLAALDQLVRQGKVLHIGCSSAYAWQFAKALMLSDQHGWARFVSMQNHYNLIYREEEREMMPLCREENIAVIPWSPLARGMLAGSRKALDDKESTSRAGADPIAQMMYTLPSDFEIVEVVKQIAEERGVQPAQVALAWLLAKPGVTAPIVGATKMDHLDAAIGAVDIELTEDEMGKLEAPYQPHSVAGMFD